MRKTIKKTTNGDKDKSRPCRKGKNKGRGWRIRITECERLSSRKWKNIGTIKTNKYLVQ